MSQTHSASMMNPAPRFAVGAMTPWLVCFSAALFFFYEFIQSFMFNSISSNLMQSFHINAEQLGTLSSVYFLANVIFLFPAGMLLDRMSTKKIILVSLSICVLGTFLFAHTHNYWVAMGCRFAAGIGSAFCFISCARLASRWFPAKRMAFVIGLIVTMAMLGGVTAQYPLTVLLNHITWRQAVVFDATLGIFFLIVISLFVKDYPPGNEVRLREEREQLNNIGFWKSCSLSYFKKQNWLCALYTSVLNIPVGVLAGLYGSIFLMQADHLSRSQASIISSAIFAGTVIGSPLIGWFSDRISRRKMPMLVGAVLSLALILLIISKIHFGYYELISLFFLLGLVTSTQVLSYPTVTESNPIMLTATAVSVVSIFTQGGLMIYQPLFGYLLQLNWTGKVVHGVATYSLADYYHAFLMLPISFVVAIVAAFFVKETYGKRG